MWNDEEDLDFDGVESGHPPTAFNVNHLTGTKTLHNQKYNEDISYKFKQPNRSAVYLADRS